MDIAVDAADVGGVIDDAASLFCGFGMPPGNGTVSDDTSLIPRFALPTFSKKTRCRSIFFRQLVALRASALAVGAGSLGLGV